QQHRRNRHTTDQLERFHERPRGIPPRRREHHPRQRTDHHRVAHRGTQRPPQHGPEAAYTPTVQIQDRQPHGRHDQQLHQQDRGDQGRVVQHVRRDGDPQIAGVHIARRERSHGRAPHTPPAHRGHHREHRRHRDHAQHSDHHRPAKQDGQVGVGQDREQQSGAGHVERELGQYILGIGTEDGYAPQHVADDDDAEVDNETGNDLRHRTPHIQRCYYTSISHPNSYY